MTMFERAANLGARQAWLWRYRTHFGAAQSTNASRLLVDVSTIIRHDAQTGIQRVVRAVWSELRRRNGLEFAVLPVFATSTEGYCYAPLDFLERKSPFFSIAPVRTQAGDHFLGLDLSAHLLPKYRRQLRAWREHGARIHVVVYDLLPVLRRSWFTPSAVTNFKKWLDVVSAEADQAICISNQVARELAEYFAFLGLTRRPIIGRLQLGADIAGSVPSSGMSTEVARILERMRFRPAVLMVGTVEPRKGYEAALEAFNLLWNERPDSPDLIIVGRPGWKTEKLQATIRSHPEFGRRLQWFDCLSDEALCHMYDACRGLLMASRGEGWGLPLVEAAMHRRFVLARDLPVFREHGLGNTLYFQDDSPRALASRLTDLVNSGQEPAPIASLPTWSDCVEGLLHAIGLAQDKTNQEPPSLRRAS